MKNNTENQTDLRKLRASQKRKSRLKKLIAVLVILLISFTLLFTKDKWLPLIKKLSSDGNVFNDGELEKGNFPLTLDQNDNTFVGTADGNLLVLTDAKFEIFNVNGKSLYVFKHGYSNPILTTSGKRFSVYDLNGNKFAVFNKTKKLFEKELDDRIMLVRTDARGKTIVVTEDQSHISILSAYDEDGNIVFQWSTKNRVTDVVFNDDHSGCYVSTVLASGGQMLSKVYGLDFSSTKLVFESELLETMIISVSNFDDDGIWAVGDDKILMLSKKGNVKYTSSFSTSLISYSTSDSLACLSLKSVENGKTKLLISVGNESKDTEIILNETVKSVLAYDGIVYVLTNKSMMAYDKNGSLLTSCPVRDDYLDFTVINDAIFLVGYRDINKITFLV